MIRSSFGSNETVGTQILVACSAAGDATATLTLIKIALRSERLYYSPFKQAQSRLASLIGDDKDQITAKALTLRAAIDVFNKNPQRARKNLDRATVAAETSKAFMDDKCFDDDKASELMGNFDRTHHSITDPWYLKGSLIFQELGPGPEFLHAMESSAFLADNPDAFYHLGRLELNKEQQWTEKAHDYLSKAASSGSFDAVQILWPKYLQDSGEPQSRSGPRFSRIRLFGRLLKWRLPMPHWFKRDDSVKVQDRGFMVSRLSNREKQKFPKVIWLMEWLSLASTFSGSWEEVSYHLWVLKFWGLDREAKKIARDLVDDANSTLLTRAVVNSMPTGQANHLRRYAETGVLEHPLCEEVRAQLNRQRGP